MIRDWIMGISAGLGLIAAMAVAEGPVDFRFSISDFGLAAEPEGIRCQTTIRFSPKGGTAEALLREILSAKSRMRIAMYGLNNPEVVDALIAAKKRGVDIAVKLDQLQSAGKSQQIAIARLKKAGIKTEISRISRLLHNKFAVIDGEKVWTGSYNWTLNAEEKNRENAVLLECAEGARRFENEWDRIE